MRWAIYRIHYGLDFLKYSIESIRGVVDKIFVIYAVNPWLPSDFVDYLGQQVPMPKLHEDVAEFMRQNYSNANDVVFFNNEGTLPRNQFGKYYELCKKKYGKPKYVLFMDPDMVFYRPDLEILFDELRRNIKIRALGVEQIELWKNFNYRIPQRVRVGPVVWRCPWFSKIETQLGGDAGVKTAVYKGIKSYNFGFCMNQDTMFYKHLAAINVSKKIGDTEPSQTWYREKWLNWNPEMRDLEISLGWEHEIPFAEPYSLPQNLKRQMNLD